MTDPFDSVDASLESCFVEMEALRHELESRNGVDPSKKFEGKEKGDIEETVIASDLQLYMHEGLLKMVKSFVQEEGWSTSEQL